MKKINDQLNERGETFSVKKFNYTEKFIKDTEYAKKSTHFVQIEKSQIFLKQTLQRSGKFSLIFDSNSGRYDLILIRSCLTLYVIHDKGAKNQIYKSKRFSFLIL